MPHIRNTDITPSSATLRASLLMHELDVFFEVANLRQDGDGAWHVALLPATFSRVQLDRSQTMFGTQQWRLLPAGKASKRAGDGAAMGLGSNPD